MKLTDNDDLSCIVDNSGTTNKFNQFMSVSEYDCAVTNKNKVENISSLFGYLNPRPDELKL